MRVLILICSALIFNLLVSCYEMPVFNNPVDPQNPNRYGSISGKITDITSNKAISGASISTSPITNNSTSDASGNYTISHVVPGAYTVSAVKTGYTSKSISISITSGNTSIANISLLANYCPNLPTITDSRDGKVYNTVLIGTQCWLSENLDVGIMILSTQNQTKNDTIQKYCYNDDSINCNIYGGYYQWDEAMQYTKLQGTQGICLNGWHVPSISELQTLEAAVNYSGNSLKSIGQGSGNGAGTNTSGFSALLPGIRNYEGGFVSFGMIAKFLSSTETNDLNNSYLGLWYNDDVIYINYNNYKVLGFSVRCIKN